MTGENQAKAEAEHIFKPPLLYRRQKFVLFAFLVFFISACTFFRPPSHDLPSREGIVPGETVVVEKNQNVYSIAKAHGVSMREVIVLNDLKPPFVIYPGQKLVLPAKDKYMAPTPSAAPTAAIEQKSLDSYTPPIQPSSEVIAKSKLEEPQKIPFGPPTEPLPAAKTSAEEKLPTAIYDGASKSGQPEKLMAEAHSRALPKPEALFLWPVQGPVISSFGNKSQGASNDGINISAPKGSPVLAAAGGIVVYAGNEMKGFGNLILIRHEGGWVTAYAHLDRMLVSRDTVVAPGDMIGTVGSTGGVSSPQLHFETRFEGKPVDPQTVMKKS